MKLSNNGSRLSSARYLMLFAAQVVSVFMVGLTAIISVFVQISIIVNLYFMADTSPVIKFTDENLRTDELNSAISRLSYAVVYWSVIAGVLTISAYLVAGKQRQKIFYRFFGSALFILMCLLTTVFSQSAIRNFMLSVV